MGGLMRFPDNTPMLWSFKSRPLGSRLHEVHGSEHGHFLDSVPVGAPQTAGTSENLLLWLKKHRHQRYLKSTP